MRARRREDLVPRPRADDLAGDFTSAWVYTLGSVIGGILAAMLYDRSVRQVDVPGTDDL